MTERRIQMEGQWKDILSGEFSTERMGELRNFLIEEKKKGKIVYPEGENIFAAFRLTPFEKVKVVILGQDPYHGPNQAHGLSFSVRPGVKPPPSLVNIYKELHSDIQMNIPNHGNLESWAEQGVLLLNSVLTVEKGKAASHQKKGWEEFTDTAIRALNDRCESIVFILWGAYAQRKGAFIDRKKHCVIESAHPSPFAAHKGFFGSKPFSRTNDFLSSQSKRPIQWESVLGDQP